MTLIVDKHYRRIAQDIDNVTMKFDSSGLLVKSKENDSKINDIENDISDNLELINTNKNDISDNLSLINTNKSNISDNLSLINTNKTNISDNLSLINSNKSNIANNYNISQINKKKSEFNATSIDNNINNINSIKNDIENYYKLKDIIIIDIIKSNIPETIDINNNEFIIINSSLNNLKKDSYLQFNSSIFIFFNNRVLPYIIGIFQ